MAGRPTVLSKVDQLDTTEKVTFGLEGAGRQDVWEKHIPGRGHSWGKGLEAAGALCWRSGFNRVGVA